MVQQRLSRLGCVSLLGFLRSHLTFPWLLRKKEISLVYYKPGWLSSRLRLPYINTIEKCHSGFLVMVKGVWVRRELQRELVHLGIKNNVFFLSRENNVPFNHFPLLLFFCFLIPSFTPGSFNYTHTFYAFDNGGNVYETHETMEVDV